ncbi:MAG: serine--tRNA ligase, partial [Oscillospiraceae bacterium]
MLDIKRIRENTQELKDALKRRGVDYSDKIDEVIKVDEDRRNLASKVDTVKAK